MTTSSLWIFGMLLAPAWAQEKVPPVDPVQVDEAIDRGITFLKRAQGFLAPFKVPPVNREFRADELVLWTYVSAGVAPADEAVQRLLKGMNERTLERTYQVALQAMILEKLDRSKHLPRIAQCAQFLADNQCRNGQWHYGEETRMPPEIDKIQPLPPAPAGKSRAAPRIPIRKRNPGPETGCNSNAQYAALGLRACADAGIQFEPVLLKRAEAWWEQSQKEDGGWCYGGKEPYHAGHPSYGAMSVGGAGSLAILKYLQAGPTWKRDRPSEKAVAWMAAKFDPARHPGAHEHGLEDMAYYYYLYGLERACTFFGTEKLGARDWYAEGARALLDAQGALGNWGEGPASIPDTCFAILFLRRATRPLKPVASVDERK